MGVFDRLFGKQKKTVDKPTNEVATIKEDPKQSYSSDFTYKEAIGQLNKLKTTGDINSFTKGDERKTIKTAANKKIKALSLPSVTKKKKKSTPGR